MKTVFQKEAGKKTHPLMGMFVALASICAFLAALIALSALVHFIMM